MCNEEMVRCFCILLCNTGKYRFVQCMRLCRQSVNDVKRRWGMRNAIGWVVYRLLARVGTSYQA